MLDNRAKEASHLDKIKDAISLLDEMVNTFLSFDKLDKGAVNLESEGIHLPTFFSEGCKNYEHSLSEGQKLILEHIGDDIVHLDRRIFKLICSNLVMNAIKYSDKNVYVKVRATVDELHLEVVDQGIGIPLENQGQIFETFFRADNVGIVQGTGLGLNIVKQYVDLLGGEISFESKENKGTTFTVVIPTLSKEAIGQKEA
jgi:signal transduction histidine kinase